LERQTFPYRMVKGLLVCRASSRGRQAGLSEILLFAAVKPAAAN
jgi:hypothetical protein